MANENLPSNPGLMDAQEACAFFGGISRTTLYGGMKRGIYPRPVSITGKAVRWVRSECEEALQRMIAERDRGRAA